MKKNIKYIAYSAVFVLWHNLHLMKWHILAKHSFTFITDLPTIIGHDRFIMDSNSSLVLFTAGSQWSFWHYLLITIYLLTGCWLFACKGRWSFPNLEACLPAVTNWMLSNFLPLNLDQTEKHWSFSTQTPVLSSNRNSRQLCHIPKFDTQESCCSIWFKPCFDQHIKDIKIASLHPRNMAKIRSFYPWLIQRS